MHLKLIIQEKKQIKKNMVLGSGELIQIFIALIMLISTIIVSSLSYKNIKITKKYNYINLFSQIVKEDREITLLMYKYYNDKINNEKTNKKQKILYEEADTILFTFYDYISMLFFQNKIDEELFINYFQNRLGNMYLQFMESTLFKNSKDRYEKFENYSKLFNFFNLSIKEISIEKKK